MPASETDGGASDEASTSSASIDSRMSASPTGDVRHGAGRDAAEPPADGRDKHGRDTAARERIDVSAWVGAYPFRDVPHPDPAILADIVVPREGFSSAWVGHLPGAFHRDPRASNDALFALLAPHRGRLEPSPIVRPDWPGWERALDDAANAGLASVRIYPAQWGLGPQHPALSALAIACGERGIVVHVTVRFEDLRQRHPLDQAGDVSAALLRGIARTAGSRCRMIVAGAGRELIEEVFWGLTPRESERVWFDFGWLWGPPDDHFAHLVRSIGPTRLVWGSFWPLRLTQQSQALIDLLPDDLARVVSADDFADGSFVADSARRAANGDSSMGEVDAQ